MSLTTKQIDAIYKLYPATTHTLGNIAYDTNNNQVAYDLAAVDAEVQSSAYKQQRSAAYPSFADQFDTIFHDGLDAWKEKIQAVKDKYPKA